MSSLSSRRLGALLAIIGILGLGILLTDQILRGAADHFYALILFVIVDFVLSGLVIAKPGRTLFKLAAIWCALRIMLQLADISQAPVYQFTYALCCRPSQIPEMLRNAHVTGNLVLFLQGSNGQQPSELAYPNNCATLENNIRFN